MATIKIDSTALRTKIESLKVEKQKIDDVLEKFKGESLAIDTYWSGNTGDMVKEELTAYSNEFDYISSKLENYILFLESVAKNYEDEDALIIKQMDTNGTVSAI